LLDVTGKELEVTADQADDADRVTREDIQQRAREVVGGVGSEATKFRQVGVAVAVGVGVAVVLAVYMLGRSKGRKRTTVVEVIRV